MTRRAVLAGTLGMWAASLLSEERPIPHESTGTSERARRKSTLALIHSPFVGPYTWEYVANELRRAGCSVVVPALTGFERGRPYYEKLASSAALQIAHRDQVILVGHSGAGALLPGISQMMMDTCSGAIFVDAILPHPDRTWNDTAPAALRKKLTDLSRDGRLPTWDQWLPPGALTRVLADAAQRARFVQELPNVPQDYLSEPAPHVKKWPPPRCAYLQLSDGYSNEAAQAARSGWRTEREQLNHLAMLTHPHVVSERLLNMTAGW